MATGHSSSCTKTLRSAGVFIISLQ